MALLARSGLMVNQISSSLRPQASGLRSAPARRIQPAHEGRSVATKAYVEASVGYAITQQAVAYAAVLGIDVFIERNSQVAPDIKIVGLGIIGTVAAVYLLNSGDESQADAAMIVGLVTTLVMTGYHAKRTVDANDEQVDWPGPKILPGTIAVISFFALNAFIQGIKAEI
mmetsp:Transcript_21412/g.36521  ORF Transcript_21412/g.36521 Transcript_21412/m.36521 type:complete len:170 (-) Transcript_21412:697-1206(-)